MGINLEGDYVYIDVVGNLAKIGSPRSLELDAQFFYVVFFGYCSTRVLRHRTSMNFIDFEYVWYCTTLLKQITTASSNTTAFLDNYQLSDSSYEADCG